MRNSVPIRRKLLMLGLTCGFVLALAPAAFADTVNITRYSKTVSGTANAGVTSVTVDLLRNTINASDATVRQQVDTFTATVGAGQAWSGSFATHAFATAADQVEVNYTGSMVPAQETIGEGAFLPTASSSTAEEIFLPASTIDGRFAIESDGSALECFSGSCSGFTATVDGGATLTQTPPGSGIIDFSPDVANANKVLITEPVVGGAFSTTVNLTDTAPLLTPLPPGTTGPIIDDGDSQASCAAFLVTNEVVCRNLTPGSYSLAQIRGGTTVSTQTVTVPAQASATSNPPTFGSASFAGLQGGDQLELASGTHVLTILTVRPFTIASARPLGDLLNGANTTVTGSCSPGEYFNDVSFGSAVDLCGSTGSLASPSDLFDSSLSLSTGDPINGTLGQLDDTSNGVTQIDMPQSAISTPNGGEAIHTPFQVIAIGRYEDPATLAANLNATSPDVGQAPTIASAVSSSPIQFAYAPLGSTNFTVLGNVNVAGGLALPALTPGVYEDRFIVSDARGDSYYSDSTFVYQGNSTGPAGAPGTSPTGPPAPVCKASSTGGLKATVKSVRATDAKAKKKKKKKATPPKLTISCTSSTAGALVAVWLQRGSSVVADGSGVVKKGKVKIVVTGTVKKGTYQLIETIDSKGLSTEATHTLTLK